MPETIFNLISILQSLTNKEIFKNTIYSNQNTFLISNKKSQYISYNSTNNNNFLIPLANTNFEQVVHLYNFVLNPLDFYTDFKMVLLIKTNTTQAYQAA